MQAERLEALRRDHALILWLLQDETIPGHIGDHLTEALIELTPLTTLPPVPGPPADGDLDPATVVGALRVRMQDAVVYAREPTEMLTLGRVGRELALAERDLTGRPCQFLLATRDPVAAQAAINR